MKPISDFRVVATSVTVSTLDVVLNLIVAILTGSTVMLSQALQGLSDLITGGILFIGVRRSKRAADQKFQFGYGRELFFWVLIASIIMFAGTGGASVYFGYQQIIDPSPVEHVWVALLMLIFGGSTNFYAFRLSLSRLREQGGGLWLKHLLSSSIVETKATFLIDFLGTFAAFLGLVSLGLFVLTNNAQFDGMGSVLIGTSMMCAALLLIRDIRDLIVGRAVDKSVSHEIISAVEGIEGVHDVLDLRTMYLGSEKLLVVVEVHLHDGMHTDDIETLIDTIKQQVQSLVPIVHHIQIEVETPDSES